MSQPSRGTSGLSVESNASGKARPINPSPGPGEQIIPIGSQRECVPTEPEAQDQFLRGQARGQLQVGIEKLAAALSIAPLASVVFRLRRFFSAAEVVGIQEIIRLSLATLELRGTGQVQGTEHSTNRFDPGVLTANGGRKRFNHILP